MREALFKDYPEHSIPRDTLIFRQGDSCTQYFVVTEGTARVFTRSADGKEVLLYYINPGEFCILTTSCLFTDERFPAEAVASSNLRIRILSKAQFQSLLGQNADFRDFVFNSYGLRIQGLIQTIQKLTMESVDQRLAKYLLLTGADLICKTHHEIAAEIGTAREVASRHLKRLEAGGIVELGRSQVRIRNREALRNLI